MIKTPPCGLKPSGDRPNFVLFVSFVVNTEFGAIRYSFARSLILPRRPAKAKFGHSSTWASR
jgi:hypothetical protein